MPGACPLESMFVTSQTKPGHAILEVTAPGTQYYMIHHFHFVCPWPGAALEDSVCDGDNV